MSLFSTGSDDYTDYTLAIYQRVTTNKEEMCSLCGDIIPSGDEFRQTVCVGGDRGEFISSRCAWCEDTFSGSETPEYRDSSEFSDDMVSRLDQLDYEDVEKEWKHWNSKPEAYRAEFTRRWPTVVQSLEFIVSDLGLSD